MAVGEGTGQRYDLPQRPAVQVALWRKSSASLLIEVPLPHSCCLLWDASPLPSICGSQSPLTCLPGMVREQWAGGALAASLGILAPASACGGCKLLTSCAKLLSSASHKEYPQRGWVSFCRHLCFFCLARFPREKEGASGCASETSGVETK